MESRFNRLLIETCIELQVVFRWSPAEVSVPFRNLRSVLETLPQDALITGFTTFPLDGPYVPPPVDEYEMEFIDGVTPTEALELTAEWPNGLLRWVAIEGYLPPRPPVGSEQWSNTEWENFVVLELVQALIDIDYSKLVAVAVTATRELVTVHFKHRELSDRDREEVEGVVEHLSDRIGTAIDSTIDIGGYWAPWEGKDKRLVFRRFWTREDRDAIPPSVDAAVIVDARQSKGDEETETVDDSQSEKAVVAFEGFGETEFLAWSLATPFISDEEVASTLGVPTEEFWGGGWSITREQFLAMIEQLGKNLADRSGAVDIFVGMQAVRK